MLALSGSLAHEPGIRRASVWRLSPGARRTSWTARSSPRGPDGRGPARLPMTRTEMARLKPWFHVVTPREDLRAGRPLDASEFAVHLDHIRLGPGMEARGCRGRRLVSWPAPPPQ